jgi:ABC-type transport system substrate-binding protein
LSSGTWSGGCVGTGPFRLVRFDPGQEAVMERNPGYWREGFPRLQNITFTRVKNQEEMFTGLRDGKFHLAEGLSPKQLDELRRAPEFAGGYQETPSLNILYLTPNSREGVFSDPAMRKRLAESVDWEGIVRTSSDFGQTPASGLIPPGLLGHDDSTRKTAAPQGGSMVTEATETSRVDVRLAIPPWWMDWRPSLIGQLRTALDRAGFNIILVGGTRDDFLRVQTEGTGDLILIGWSADFPDTHAIVYGILDSRRGQLKAFLAPRYTESLDRLLQQARAERKAATRHALYREVEEILAREHLVIPIAFDKVCQLARPELQGVRLSFVQPFVAYEQLRIER